ncbi:hypothetical protein DVA67_006970 [Solirubrobacter sp. CPCC 204708]|uniref:Uncharacterized protein n=1 Tax=Solirubrobacter deserti TaxID=2282478 RepID=A0ABT4RPG0_9ACTN|nr:hypothetical protein [Solirubrobacter deserti]MBE2315710.1 hypothetical protein [Solirubrobacter deserti]MDA0140401.1 hypothetical protein [Solirubrobacter deserti]
MPRVRALVVSPEEAVDGNAELWCGGELLAITVLHEGRLHLRLDPRRDGEPWLIDTETLAAALDDATRQIAAY